MKILNLFAKSAFFTHFLTTLTKGSNLGAKVGAKMEIKGAKLVVKMGAKDEKLGALKSNLADYKRGRSVCLWDGSTQVAARSQSWFVYPNFSKSIEPFEINLNKIKFACVSYRWDWGKSGIVLD